MSDIAESKIEIVELNQNVYEVTVNANRTSVHEVTVTMADVEKLNAGNISKVDLIKQSFLFLLARESNTSILRRFDLSVISHYFPEYIESMRQIFSART